MALAFDVENDWNYKNRNQIAQGRWQASSSSSSRGGSNNSSSDASFTKVRSGSCDYGWLCDLINRYGEGETRLFFSFTSLHSNIIEHRKLLAKVIECYTHKNIPFQALKPLQNKKSQKNLGYPRKKQSFSL